MRLILAYKNFAAKRGVSHIGLGVAALNTTKVLRQKGIDVDVWPVVSADDLRARLAADPAVTHVVVSAFWLPTAEWARLVFDFPRITFAVNCHSNVGFLQADTNGCKLLREALDLQQGHWRFRVAANSRRFCRWVEAAYSSPCQWLPNLYGLAHCAPPPRPLWRGGTVRVGLFGAGRTLKNFTSAAGACLELHAQLREPVEIWLSVGRADGNGQVLESIRQLCGGIPGVSVVVNHWQPWPEFLRTVGLMHLLMQPSHTETFNIVTADGVAQGVPSVASSAIDWVPRHWHADPDDVSDIARVARNLLADPFAATEGRQALERHNRRGVQSWLRHLKDSRRPAALN